MKNSMKKHWFVIVARALLLLALVAVCISFATEKNVRWHFYNSDALYIPTLYHDLFSGHSLWGWNPPPVPYFFPDIPLYFLIHAIVGNLHLALIVFGIVQYLLLLWGIILLSRQLWGRRESVEALIILAGAALALFFATGQAIGLMPLFLSDFHSGALLSLIFALGLMAYIIKQRDEPFWRMLPYYLLLWLLSTATTASDAIFIVQFLIPALGCLWVLFLCSMLSQRQLAAFSLALMPAGPLGHWINRSLLIFRTSAGSPPLTPDRVLSNMTRFYRDVLDQWGRDLWFSAASLPVLQIIWGSFAVIGLVLFAWALFQAFQQMYGQPREKYRRIALAFFTIALLLVLPSMAFGKYPLFIWGGIPGVCTVLGVLASQHASMTKPWFSAEERAWMLMLSFGTLSILSTIGAAIITGGSQARYFLPALLFPLFFGWPFLLARWQRSAALLARQAVQLGILVIMAGFLFGYGNFGQIATLTRLADYYPEFVQCLDAHVQTYGLQRGISQYWSAKHLIMLSKKNLMIVQARRDLYPDHWINNLNWYNQEFDFVIADAHPTSTRSIDETVVIRRFGPPAKTFSCSEQKILVYNRPEDTAFQQQFTSLFNFDFTAAQLPSEIGRLVGSSRIAEEGTDAKGFLTYGPYVDLMIGDYAFEITVAVQTSGEPLIGRWDVVSHPTKDEEILLKKGKFDRDGEQTISGVFKVRQEGEIEIRTNYQGKGTLRVDRLVIKRIR